ncbi:MAG: divalent-cation tolerance protein CutA [Candidatus Altiarchaeota archaeon]|nr:divalent-cation tolerance protein CutA [Candidatus Altiarchaeota archaeon]
MILVYITCRGKAEAEKIAKHLLDKRLIACANFFPIESMYWWEGKITEDKEYVVIAKTLKKRFSEVAGAVREIHSHRVPCILRMGVEANREFIDWVRGNVR